MSNHISIVRRGLVVGMAAFVLGVTAACSAGTSTPGSTTAGSVAADVGAAKARVAEYSAVPSGLPDVASATLADLKGKSIWYVPIFGSAPTIAAMGNGLTAAAKAVGASVHVCDGKAVPTTIDDCLHQAIDQGADAVVTAFIDYTLTPNAFDALVKAKIPVLLAGATKADGVSPSPSIAFYDTSPTLALSAELQIDVAVASGATDFLYVANTDSPDQIAVSDAALAYAGKLCPGCKVKLVQYQSASIDKLKSQVSAELLANPAVSLIVMQNGPQAQYVIGATQDAGRTDVKLVAANASLDGLQRVKDGTTIADSGQSALFFGWQFADGIFRMLSGDTPEFKIAPVRLFTTENIGSVTLDQNAFFDNSWYGGEGFTQAFLKAWGVS